MESLNSNYQTKLLQVMASNPQFLYENRSLISDDIFADIIERLIAEFLLEYYDEYKEIPPRDDAEDNLFNAVGTEEEKQLVGDKLEEIYTSNVNGLSFLSDKVREHTGKIRIGNLAKSVWKTVNEEGSELDTVLSQIQQETLKFSRAKSSLMDLNDMAAFDEWLDYRLNKDKYRLSTGYPVLDSRIDGGLGKGDLVLFVVGAKSGKSTMLLNMALNQRELGRQGIYFTLEINQLVVYHRQMLRVTQKTNEEIDKILISEKLRAQLREQVEKNAATLGNLRIVKYPSKGATVLDIEGMVRSCPFKVDYIAVDYLREVRPIYTYPTPRERLADVGEGLKSLADRLGIPVMTAAQGNRASKLKMATSDYDDKKLLEGSIDIAECYDLVGISDLVITINQDDHDRELGQIRLYLSESRVGTSKGTPILYAVDFATQSITEIGEVDSDDDIEYTPLEEVIEL